MKPYIDSDGGSDRPYWEVADSHLSDAFWEDMFPVAEWRVELEKHRVRALDRVSGVDSPPPSPGGSVERPDADARGLDLPVGPSSIGAGGASLSAPSAPPSEENS